MTKYQHLFFDLDRTLWDFNKNSGETLGEICAKFKLLENYGITDEQFTTVYFDINEQMWEKFRNHAITKPEMRDQRFYLSLKAMGVDDKKVADEISRYYLSVCPKKPHLITSTLELLSNLHKQYQLHIITNGFAEAQYVKLTETGIGRFFKQIFISEEIGFKKPQKEIFEFALDKVNAKAAQSLMIGDDYDVDIMGAAKVGMDQIYFNPAALTNDGRATYEIKKLSEINVILG